VNSRSVAADLRSATRQKAEIVYNAVDLQRFSPHGPALNLDALSGLAPADGILRVGLVATFAHWKGHHTFLKALSLLPPDAPVRGYIIGGPIYQTAGSQLSLEGLRSEVRRFGLANSVGFTGFVDDTAAAMRALDIVVHASTSPEPFGMVIVEAMACGKAVIASQGGGATEIFTDGVDAIGHCPADALDLSNALKRLLSDSGLRLRLGSAGRRTAESQFDRPRLAREVSQLYRESSNDLCVTPTMAVAARN